MTDRIRVEGNRRKSRPRKKRTEVPREDIRTCRVDEGMVTDRYGLLTLLGRRRRISRYEPLSKVQNGTIVLSRVAAIGN